MIKSLSIIGIIILIILVYVLIRNNRNRKLRLIITLLPLLFGVLLYLFILLLTKDITENVCDGGALVGIFTSFILIGIGIILNVVDITYRLIRQILIKGENIKYKKQIIIVLVLGLIFMSYFMKKTKINRRISKDLDINIPYTLDFQYTDSHGGFLGDGITLARTELTDKDINKILKGSEKYWVKYPLDKELDTILYGGPDYESNLALMLEMRDIKNGYWIFIDRQGNERRHVGREELLDRYSNNYSIGLIDLDENRFYYVKFDS